MFQVGNTVGKLNRFLIEPFVEHEQSSEFYVAMFSERDGDWIYFHDVGGVDIGDVDAKAKRLFVKTNCEATVTPLEVAEKLLAGTKTGNLTKQVSEFIAELYQTYVRLFFTYLEINPLVVKPDGTIYAVDMAAKIDQCAEFLVSKEWGRDLEFPTGFGREPFPEEAYIQDLDKKSGASLKLSILNKNGRVWTMVAGGGASVIYADTICELGGAEQLANYGEYSGAPTEQQTYDYARTILALMTTTAPHPEGKVLIIGGGIANFTNVASTFKGIVHALKDYQSKLIEHKVKVFVRRGGPNYQEGLRVMRDLGNNLGIPVHVFGPETHMTSIVSMALGKRDVGAVSFGRSTSTTANFLLPQPSATLATSSGVTKDMEGKASSTNGVNGAATNGVANGHGTNGSSATCDLFTPHTKAIILGMQLNAVQGMLDYDFVCQRKEPSIVAMTYPMIDDHKQKFYWGHQEILMPVYKSMKQAFAKHPDATVLINFASLRSAYEATLECLDCPQVRTIAILAEGIPENFTRKLLVEAQDKQVTMIGPASVGGIRAGAFKIGYAGGMLDNIVSAKLYREGSVAYVSRSGGMSNELNNIISRTTDGLVEGIAIGGDRYPLSTFLDHMLRYEANPSCKMIVLLGEIGGTEEYRIIEAIKDGRIKKPVVAWCYGTCAAAFSSEVQFGHAGSCANAESETAAAKNAALKAAGVHVPKSFDDLPDLIRNVYESLVADGTIVPKEEVTPPTVPMDYKWARELGLIRKPASFMSSICDDRGQELLYAGIPITQVITDRMGIGGVLGLLWFQRRLPKYACEFMEMCLMVTADHGPAVSGAHNTIVCARAGKDLVSSLTSGLLTIGDRFGGALDGAARQFSSAYDSALNPHEFVNKMRKEGKLIMGIGHRVKSINNPDKRVQILKQFCKDNFAATPLLSFAEEVEKITTAKKPNLILNVDGLIGVAMVDMMRNCGCFSTDEVTEYIELGVLNAIFILGRSMGFIGHFLDQRRLKQGLYRHPWDDIAYVMPELMGDNPSN